MIKLWIAIAAALAGGCAQRDAGVLMPKMDSGAADAPAQRPIVDPAMKHSAIDVPAATAPTSGPFINRGASSGGFLIVGTVAAEANGTPIYADKVLTAVQKALAGKAPQLTVAGFRAFARDQIDRKIKESIADELEYAAADRNLSEEDKLIAKAMTEQYRTRRITDAGGSLAVARRQSAEQGFDFEEEVEQQHRRFAIRIFYERRLYPRIQVSADDMRRYYDANLAKEFTEQAAAKFRVIKVDIAQMGDRKLAAEKIDAAYRKVQAGTPFDEVAAQENNDPVLRAARGDRGWIDKGSLVAEKLEKAVWDIEVGQVTPIVEDQKAFFVAKLEDRRAGRTLSFDEQAVQDRIRTNLRNAQFTGMRNKERDKLMEQAVVRYAPEMLESVVEMAMQHYPAWAAADAAPTPR